MLSEEALILVGAFAGLALLVLGVVEELSPSRQRHRRRPSPARDPWRRARTGPLPPVPSPLPEEVPVESEPPIERLLFAQVEPVELPRAVEPVEPLLDEPEPAVEDQSTVVDEPRAAEAPWVPPAVEEPERPEAPEEPEEPEAPEPQEPAPTAEESPLERLSAFWEEKRYTELVGEGLALIETTSFGPEDSAKLWGLVGLAKQALGDPDGARAAFEEAIIAAPPADRRTWERHQAALALSTARTLLDRAQGGGAVDADERATTVRSAINWLEGGLAVAAGDSALRDTLTTAREALWPTYAEVINGLVQRQEYHSARRLLREALADQECPVALQADFRELLSATFGGEIGQLTAEAIRRMQEGKEEEALATLDRAESLLATIPPEAIPPKRRQELERRLWWSYTKLGIRRVEGGMFEEAVGPLMHALSFEGVGPERQEETQGPLVRALNGIVEARTSLIRKLTDEGDREAALAICDKLWTFFKNAMEHGVTKEELAGPLGRAQQLFDKLGRRQS